MSDDQVLLTTEGPVATITLNRPAKLNALTPAMLARLEAICDELEADREARVVLVRGAGERAFCVGADVTLWGALAPIEMWRSWIRSGHRVFERLARLRQPTIAVLHGYAFGGGLELALACDMRLAAEGAALALPEVKLATLPGWGGTQRLPQLIGPARTKQLIFSGARLDAAHAERWGLVNEVVAADALLERASALAAEIAANAPLSVQMAKQLIDGAGSASATLEALAGALAASSEDGREGQAAFRQKRPPQFSGN
jgi:enoyl-CoA hydratase